MKRGIIFDMDGTLWDSAEQVAYSWNKTVRENGFGEYHITVEALRSVMGKPMDELARSIFCKSSQEEQRKLLALCETAENQYIREHGGKIYPGVQNTLEELRKRGYHLYIVSNCQSGYIEAFLDFYNLHDFIEDLACFGNNQRSKGENIANVMKRNGLDEAVYVGDIQGDLEASREAGAGFIHAAYGFGKIRETVPAIHCFSELPDLAEKVFGRKE